MNGGPEVHERKRSEMVEQQIAARGVRDDRVLEAMRTVPRERFVGEEVEEFAYEDSALPIEARQTISQPYVVAVMVEALQVEPGDRVLEVGAGSGYAAAVLSRIADEVFAIERHRILVEAARRSLGSLGYGNVRLRHGDGTLGWEEEAPFDAILVSAGGAVPEALKEQLAPGGRMIIPVGEGMGSQDLILFQKEEDQSLTERNLGAVRFVPLIGTVAEDPGGETPSGDNPGHRSSQAPFRTGDAPSALDRLRRHAEAFDGDVEEVELSRALNRMAGHTVLLLGEASHGTSEFYRIRARLTRELITRGEIDFVAVEADWPDAAVLDRWVRGVEREGPSLAPFQRFPRWMWANQETLGFLRWLRGFNQEIPDPEERVGFFGLDLYSLHSSIEEVLAYLDDVDPDTAGLARDRFGCLTPWEKDPQTYGRLASMGRMEACEEKVLEILQHLLEKRLEYERADGLKYLDAVENARLVANAERYYRAIYQGPKVSWNLRDQHMFDTLLALLGHHSPDASAAVWAHNSHLGDASATELSAGGKHNLGQLCRQRFGRGCYSVGMGTHTGTVLAAQDWGDPGEIMEVRPSLEGSYERLCHEAEEPAFFLPLREEHSSVALRRDLAVERLQRAIGVIYRPATERMSHYFHAALPRQFDEWVFLDRTQAVEPLVDASEAELEGIPDMYPFGV